MSKPLNPVPRRSVDPVEPVAFPLSGGEYYRGNVRGSLLTRLEDYSAKAGLTKVFVVSDALDEWLRKRGAWSRPASPSPL